MRKLLGTTIAFVIALCLYSVVTAPADVTVRRSLIAGDLDADINDIATAYNVNVDANNKISGTRIATTLTTASLTNGQALTVAAPVYILTGTGGANDTTNTITIANPTAAGDVAELIVEGASTNLIGLADSGNLKLASAWVGDNNDVIKLRAVSTSVWVEVGRSDN